MSSRVGAASRRLRSATTAATGGRRSSRGYRSRRPRGRPGDTMADSTERRTGTERRPGERPPEARTRVPNFHAVQLRVVGEAPQADRREGRCASNVVDLPIPRSRELREVAAIALSQCITRGRAEAATT
jgi:hypothetical protein